MSNFFCERCDRIVAVWEDAFILDDTEHTVAMCETCAIQYKDLYGKRFHRRTPVAHGLAKQPCSAPGCRKYKNMRHTFIRTLKQCINLPVCADHAVEN